MERPWVLECKTGGAGVGGQGGVCKLLQLCGGIFKISRLWLGPFSGETEEDRCTQALLLCVLVRRRDTDTPCFWKPTCFCRHFQEVAVQVDVKVRRLPGQRNARAIPAHGQVLLEADGAGAQHQLHRLGPGEGAGPARIVLHQHLKGRGRGGAVFCQNVLTRPLKVKCPSVKSVVVGISENRADAGLCG